MSNYLQCQVMLLILLSFLLNVIESGWVGPIAISYNRVDYLSGVWLTDTTNILVGNRQENGAIIKTMDGGTTWSTKLTPTSRLFDVASITLSAIQYVVSVANDGKAYYSSDGGDTWASVTVTTAALYGVSIGSNGNVFAVGYQTTPSALSIIFTSTVSDLTTWTSSSITQTQTLNGVSSFDGIKAIAVGAAGTILKSTDAGVSWQSITSGTTADLYSISQISADVAMIAGSQATVMATADGGVSWRSESLAGYGSGSNKILSTTIFYFRSIAMLDVEGKAFLVSPTNIVLLTRNAGISWAVGSDDLQYPLYSIVAYNESIAMIGSARAESTSQSAAFKRTAGSDFSPFPTSQPTSYPTGTTLKNTAWFRSYLGSSLYTIRSAAWSSSNNVVMVGSFTTTTGIIVYSKNAGFSWNVINTPNVMTSVATRTISNVVYYLAVSVSGSIYLSTTLGKNWTNSTATKVSPALYGVSIGGNGVAYAVGYSSSSGSIIHKSTAPFSSWSSNLYSQSGVEINNVLTYDGRRVIAVGNTGLILTSNDTGLTWHVRSSGTTNDLYSISGFSSTLAVVAGKSATVLKTTDAGLNWTATGSVIGKSSVSTTTDFLFNSISMVTESIIYLAGSNGALLVSVNGGVNWRNESNIAYNRQAILYSLAMYSTGTGVCTDSDGNAYVKYQTITSQPSYQPAYIPPSVSYYPSVIPTAKPTNQFEIYMLIPVSQDFINVSIYAGPSFALTYSTDSTTNTITLNSNRSHFQTAVSSFVTTVPSNQVSANITSTIGYFGYLLPTFQPTLAPVTVAPISANRYLIGVNNADNNNNDSNEEKVSGNNIGRDSSYYIVDEKTENVLIENSRSTNPDSLDSEAITTAAKKLSHPSFELDSGKFNSNINQGLTFNYTLYVLVEFSHLSNATFGKYKNLSYLDFVYEEIYAELQAAVATTSGSSSSSWSTQCSTVFRKVFNTSSSFGSMTCEPRITIGPYTLGDSLQNTKSPSSNDDDMIGSLTRRDFIILMCFMAFLFIALIVLFKIAFQGGGDDGDGEGSNFTFMACLGVCFSVSCCSCIFCWRSLRYCFSRNSDDDDDDDDDDEDNKKKTTKAVAAKGKNKVAESKQKDDDDDEEDDEDDEDEENKDGWFSRMFKRKKSTGDDDDDDIGKSKSKKKDDDDDDDDDDGSKKKGGWFSNIFGGKKKSKNDDDDDDDDDE